MLGLYLVLKLDVFCYIIVVVSNVYVWVMLVCCEDIVGCGLFEIFLDNFVDLLVDGVCNFVVLLVWVVEIGGSDVMVV